MTQHDSKRILLYIGTYTHGKSQGIYVYQLDQATGALAFVDVFSAGDHPSFLAFHPSNRYLYAVNETMEFGGKSSGGVSAFAVDPQSGALTFINQQASEGGLPCHLAVDQTGRYLVVANYQGGSVAMLPVREDGSLGPACDFHQHHGDRNPKRRQVPHAHCTVIDPHNRFVLIPECGLDRIMVYGLDLDQGKLVPNDPPWAEMWPGAGPRHLAFHPNGTYVYVINETSSTMVAFSYDATRGVLSEIEATFTLPEDFMGRSACADVHIHPSGRFLYGSNRGHDSIVVYRIDEATGKMITVQWESTQGKIPRNFALDPTGTWLFAENQNSDTVVCFRIDQETGKLTPTGQVVEVPVPVCIQMLAVPL